MKILHIDSSVTGEKSVSRPLTKETTAKLQALNPGAEVIYRDLINDPLRHYTAVVRLYGAETDTHTPEQKHELEVGDAILKEFLEADIVVVGAPMYNLNIPSQLKAWIDLVVVPGTTFKYGASGPEGQCGGKRMVIVSSRGGKYGPDSPASGYDFQEKYLQSMFGFLGITDISVVRAEGAAMGPEAAAAAIAEAKQHIADLK